jgi:PHD/YefM family antitoxin component YafN of YafNO toxin-antitoxin module
MIDAKEQFVIDENGKPTSVLIDLKRYDELLEAWEELESIRRFDEARSANGEKIPFPQAINEIEKDRK